MRGGLEVEELGLKSFYVTAFNVITALRPYPDRLFGGSPQSH